MKSKLNIPVNEPLIIGNAKKYINNCIDTGWISSEGEYVSKFENEFAKYNNRKYGISVTSGTSALDLSIEVLNLKPGDEVILPSFTIISCIIPLIKRGIKPILVDSDINTWNMDVDSIENKITIKTKAIMVVHTYGLPVDMNTVIKISKKYNLDIIEDAAEAHGVEYNNKKCGGFGKLSIFSFYANKLITTGEGGIILTDSITLANKLRSFRNLCFSAKERFKHYQIGWNYRMTNLQAAIGLSQLENIDKFIKIKKNIGKKYTSYLEGVNSLQLPLSHTSYSSNLYWVYGIIFKDINQSKKNEIVIELKKYGVGTRPFFFPMHKQPILKKMGYFKNVKLPNSELMYSKGIYLPSGLTLKNSQIKSVAELLIKILKKNKIY